MNRTIILLVIFFSCFGAKAQLTSKDEVPADQVEKRDSLKKALVSEYLTIQNSLIVSDSQNVAKVSGLMAVTLKKFKFKRLTIFQMNEATVTREELAKLANELAQTTNPVRQRKLFS